MNNTEVRKNQSTFGLENYCATKFEEVEQRAMTLDSH